MNLKRIIAAALLSGDEGVERATPGGAPIAFRIWKGGENVTDHGTHVLTRASIQRLLADQATRGNLYSIDVDHLSLSKEAPPESRKSVGWFAIEERGDELWATRVEWTDVVRAGLEKNPPEWRYHSPAYDVDRKTGEIVSLTNLALTNNPATHRVTALASSVSASKQEYDMNFKECLAALMGDDEEKKKEAIAAMKAAFGDDADGEKKDEKKKEETKASEDPPAEKKDEEKKEATTAAQATATGALLTVVKELESKVTSLDAEREKRQRSEVLATRKDLPDALVKHLMSMPLDQMKATIAVLPVTTPDPAAAAKVTATRGAGQGGTDGVRASMSPPEERQRISANMGLSQQKAKIHSVRNKRIYPMIDRDEAKRVYDATSKAMKEGAK